MKNKKIIWLLSIIILLTISFFMSGGREVVPLSPEDMKGDTGFINDVDLDERATMSLDNSEDSELLDQENEADGSRTSDGDIVKDEKLEKEKDKKINVLVEDKTEDEKDKIEEKKKEETKNTGEKTEEAKVLKKQIIEEDNKNKGEKDKYLTDPVPEGKPKPKEWQDTKINKDKKLKATLSVTCKSILNNMDMFNMDKIEVLPEDGIIYPRQTVTFSEGESVFDVLLREMQKNKIHMEFVMTPIYNSNYVEGINNLYEFDCGELSGWMYRVNGWFPNYGCSRYVLEDGDVIEWIYTCDLGRDIGGDWAVTGGE